MISFIIFLIGLTIALGVLFSTRANMYKQKPDPYNDRKTVELFNIAWLYKPVGIFIATLLISIIQPWQLQRVDAGCVGVKVNLSGDERGLAAYQYKTGWVGVNTWAEQLVEIMTTQQHIEYAVVPVITKGGFPAKIKPSFNYAVKANNAGDMWINLKQPLSMVEQGWLMNAVIGSINDVANRWNVDSIFNHREAFEACIVGECNKRVTKWFEISQLRSNIVPPEELQSSIIAKTKAIQDAKTADQQAVTAEAVGRRKRADAQADSVQLVTIAAGHAAAKFIDAQGDAKAEIERADGEAKAILKRQAALSQLYVEYVKASGWNGVLPTTVLGNATPMLNLNSK